MKTRNRRRKAAAETPTPDPSLDQMGLHDLRLLPYNALVRLAKAAGLPTAGKKPALLARLTAARVENAAAGPPDASGPASPADPPADISSFEPANMKCTVCRKPTRVVGTQKVKMKDGRTMIIRSMRCTGRHHHTMPHKQIIGTVTGNQ